MTTVPLVQPLDVRFSSIPFHQSSPPALQTNLQGRNRDDSRNCDRDQRDRPSQPSTSVSSGSPTIHLASQPPRHTPVPQSPADTPLPTSAPAHTPSFTIPPLPPLDSIQAQNASPFVKVEPDQSPTSWSEPPRYQPRDLGSFVPYPPPYRGLDNWPQTNQPQQYTYWNSQGYPAIMPPAPPQVHPVQDDKRRQRELNKARRHVCPVCDKRFNRPSSLNTHMSVHTGAKPYQCLREGCGRRFSVSSNLRRHERTHEARARPAKLPAPVAARAQMTPYHPGTQYYTPGNYYLQAPTTQPQFDYSMPSAGLRNYAVVGAGSGANQNTPRSRETMPPAQYQPQAQHSTSASTQALLQHPKSMSS